MKIRNAIVLFCSVTLAASRMMAYDAQLENGRDFNGPIEPKAVIGHIDPLPLRPGEIVHRKATAAEPQIFRIHLDAGTSVTITFGRREMPMMVWLYSAPTGQLTSEWLQTAQPLERESLSSDGSSEPFEIVTDESHDYIVKFIDQMVGDYTFTCSDAHSTTEKDRRLAEANRAFVAIREAVETGKPFSSVRDEFELRVAVYREVNDENSLGLALLDVGRMFIDNRQYEESLVYIDEGKRHFASANNLVDQYAALALLSGTYEALGDYQTVIDVRNQMVDLAKVIGPKPREYGSVFGLGVTYHRLGDVTKAREYYDRAFEMARSVDPPDADSLSQQALYYTNLGNLYRGMNGGEIPIPFFPKPTRADYERALTYLQNGLAINERINRDYPGFPTLLVFNRRQVANTYKELGRYDEALAVLSQLLTTTLAAPKPNKALLASTYVHIGSVYARQGNVAKTIENFDKEISLLREGAYNSLRNGFMLSMADDYVRLGELGRAKTVVQEALEYSRTVDSPAGIADDLLSLARIERELGNFNNARTNVEEAIQIEESLRSRITNDELRTTYFSSVKRFYDFYVELLMQSRTAEASKNLDALALQASEKARSRTLLDLLTVSGVDIKKGIDPALLELEKRAREQLMTKANEQTRLMLRKHMDEDANRIRAEMLELTTAYEQIQNELRSKSPKYAALATANALSVKQIQALLDPGTALLEYALTEKKSFLWVVTRDSLTSFDLAPKADIESAARQAYNFITERNRVVVDETADRARARRRDADTAYASTAAALSQKLLGPAADAIRNKRLVIVPDGALNFISFASLPEPRPAINGQGLLLGSGHEIVMLPSASTLAALRESEQNRSAADRSVAIFADPVFDPTDNRTKPSANVSSALAKAAVTRDFERAVADVGLSASGSSSLQRLPFSRREADAIFAASPTPLSIKNLDFAASKQNVFDEQLSRYRILHFASHSLLDSDHPDLSGIVLSLVDKTRKPVDGFLRLRDIYDLKLNADLVVLSACNTALGAEVRGEGLIGLTRGFMYAGTSRVVASLWKVDDAATAALMSMFYRNIFKEQMRPAAALRAAQNEIRKQPRWSSPYYWAPFILQGDWR